MGNETDSPDAEALLEHAGFLRALARSLIGDAHRAEDVVQETFLAAIRRPPRFGSHARGWLAAVARNLSRRTLRTEGRRRRRETVAASSREAAAPAVDTVGRLETQRAVVDAVLALGEPYRTTLVRRYFDELRPVEIARREGVPEGTVRTRIRRGLEQVRRRLDAGSEGGRKAWVLALLPFLPKRAAAAAGAGIGGAILMSAKLKIAVGVVVLAALAAGLSQVSPLPDPPPPRTEALPGAPPAPEEPAPPASAEAGVSAREATAPDGPADAPPTAGAWKLSVTVLDSTGRPVKGARVARLDDRGVPSGEVETGEEGVATLPCAGREAVAVTGVEGHAPVRLEGLMPDGKGESEVTVRLDRGSSIRGVLLGAEGGPIRGAGIRTRPLEDWPWLGEWRRYWVGRTDDGGAFEVGGLLPGRYALEVIAMPSRGAYPEPAVEASAGDSSVMLRLAPVQGLVVRILDASTGEYAKAPTEILRVADDMESLLMSASPGTEVQMRHRLPADLRIRVVAEGYLPSEVLDASIPAGRSGQVVEARLVKDPTYETDLAHLTLVIRDDLGRGVTRVTLCGSVPRSTKELGEEGRLEIQVPPGKQVLRIRSPAEGEPPRSLLLPVSIEVDLPPGGREYRNVLMSRAGCVLLRTGGLTLSGLRLATPEGRPVAVSTSPAKEGWLLSSLPPGPLVVEATLDTGETLRRTVEVAPEETTPLTLELEAERR
jgi:RNA polymerase sigma-70 factor (ECF subfamily)